MEGLEARLAFDVSAAVAAGVLTVRGGDGADVIRITADGPAIRVEDQAGTVGEFTDVSFAFVDGGAGDDQIIEAANVTIPVTLSGGDGADTLVAQGKTATLDGGAGTDAFWAGAKTVISANDL